MRAVLTGTDFIKDFDGSFKAIETNTNIGLSVDVTRYLDLTTLTDFVQNNEINEIVVIYNPGNMQLFGSTVELEPENLDYNRHNYTLIELIKEHYSGSSVNVVSQQLSETAVTIPVIEDSDNKLIIRVAFDTTALIDDTYARDNWEFLKLMNDTNPNSIPKTYINDIELGFDSIGTTLRDNGNHPNYCIKKRITPADNNVYPKLIKVTSIEQLNEIKTNLEIDEYIQEFTINQDDLFNNKLKVYRSVDMVYGPNLDILNLWIMEHSTIIDMVSNPDYDDNNQVQIWERNRYTTKYNSKTSDVGIKFSADEGTKILDSNNNIIQVENLNVNDFVKSLDFPNIPHNSNDFISMEWTGTTQDVIEQCTITTSQVVSKTTTPYFGEIIEFVLENGSVFSDVPHAQILIEDEISGSTVAKFAQFRRLDVGLKVFVWDNLTNTMELETITNVYYSYQQLNAYTLNVNQFDLFLTLEESNNNRFGLVTHNYNYDCRAFSCNGWWQSQYIPGGYYDCYSGQYLGNSCTNVGLCLRIGSWYPNATWAQCQYQIWSGCYAGNVAVQPGGYCNYNKPSDENIKERIKYIDTTKDGLKIYKFEYNKYIKDIWLNEFGENLEGIWKGVMAQDLIGTEYESALTKHDKGFYVVNYEKLPKIII